MRGLLIGLGIAVAVWALAVIGLMVAGRGSKARELATLIPNLIVLFRGLVRVVPEFIPIAGPVDDIVVAALVLRHVLKRTDRAVVLEHWRGNPATLEAIV